VTKSNFADLVIVGGGVGGRSLAFYAARLDPTLKSILVERQDIAWIWSFVTLLHP